MRRIALYCLVLLALLPLMAARGGGFGRVRHNITRAPDTPAAPKYNKRAASNIQAKLAEPWPLANLADKGPRRYVIYCFRDEAVRDENYCEIEMAIWRWYKKPGYEPDGEAGRHRMRIGEMDYSQNKLVGIFTHEVSYGCYFRNTQLTST